MKFFTIFRIIFLISIFVHFSVEGRDFPSLVKEIKPSVVGIGVYDPLGTQKNQLRGTGFVVGDGYHIITNAHVVEAQIEEGTQQQIIVLEGKERDVSVLPTTIVELHPSHDLALLKIGKKLSALTLHKGDYLPDGSDIAFTGFPIGSVLGLYPATHKGMISARTPDVLPTQHSSKLSIQMVKRLRNPFFIYQLDATAYPGNSGSPVYNVESGDVVAVINKVFVTQGKESALSKPSGITYAIPVRHVITLLENNKVAH